ncbi:NB-ARC domain-containing protein [Cladophialophora immunda]|nr:NB-ARC domain-containing protein [Cladophialophora immunda]
MHEKIVSMCIRPIFYTFVAAGEALGHVRLLGESRDYQSPAISPALISPWPSFRQFIAPARTPVSYELASLLSAPCAATRSQSAEVFDRLHKPIERDILLHLISVLDIALDICLTANILCDANFRRMSAALNRREKEHVNKIRQALDGQRLVIIVGAGLSLSAIRPPLPRITWIGLIRDGLDYLEAERFVAGDDEELALYRKLLSRSNLKIETALRACGYLKDVLDSNKHFPNWLDSVFGSLHQEVNHPEIFEALRKFHERGARLMTTNYDELLEHHCGLHRVRRMILEDVRKYEQGTLDGVFHIHGSFQDPQEVVLDPVGYYKVKTSDDVQNLLKTYLGHNTILFVGCGSGLEDPNFKNLLEWATSREENIPNHHYLLVRERDDQRYNPLITLRYGPEYEDLVPYLNALLEDPASALTTNTSAGRMTSAATEPGPHYKRKSKNIHWYVPRSGNPLFTGRVEVLEKIERAIMQRDESKQKRFVITGMGGQGKSEICLRIADQVRKAFWGVFWVDVSSESSAVNDFFTISHAFSVPSENIDDTRHKLSNEENDWLLVLDNADEPETRYERYIPSGTRGAILMTSRNPQCMQRYSTVGSEELGSLSKEDCITLILRAAGFPAESQLAHTLAATRIIDALGSHTLAVIQAGAYVGQGFCSLEQYPTEFQRQCDRLLKFGQGQAHLGNLSVYATFEASAHVLESLAQEHHRDALSLLHLLALGHYDNIPLDLFEAAWKGAGHVRKTSAEDTTIDKLTKWHVSQLPQFMQVNLESWDSFRLVKALNTLQSLALVSRGKGPRSHMVSMHPITHAWAKIRQDSVRKCQSWQAAGCLLALSSYCGATWRSNRTHLKLHLMSFLNIVDVVIYDKKTESMPMKIIQLLFQCGQLLDELRVDSVLEALLDRLFGELDVDPTDPIKELLPLYRLFSNNLQNIGKAKKAARY